MRKGGEVRCRLRDGCKGKKGPPFVASDICPSSLTPLLLCGRRRSCRFQKARQPRAPCTRCGPSLSQRRVAASALYANGFSSSSCCIRYLAAEWYLGCILGQGARLRHRPLCCLRRSPMPLPDLPACLPLARSRCSRKRRKSCGRTSPMSSGSGGSSRRGSGTRACYDRMRPAGPRHPRQAVLRELLSVVTSGVPSSTLITVAGGRAAGPGVRGQSAQRHRHGRHLFRSRGGRGGPRRHRAPQPQQGLVGLRYEMHVER